MRQAQARRVSRARRKLERLPRAHAIVEGEGDLGLANGHEGRLWAERARFVDLLVRKHEAALAREQLGGLEVRKDGITAATRAGASTRFRRRKRKLESKV